MTMATRHVGEICTTMFNIIRSAIYILNHNEMEVHSSVNSSNNNSNSGMSSNTNPNSNNKVIHCTSDIMNLLKTLYNGDIQQCSVCNTSNNVIKGCESHLRKIISISDQRIVHHIKYPAVTSMEIYNNPVSVGDTLNRNRCKYMCI